MKEEDHGRDMDRQHGQLQTSTAANLPQTYSAGPQGSGVQQVAQPPFVVLDDRHPADDRQEERVEEQGQDGKLLATANSDVIQALVPPTDESPLWICIEPVDMPQALSTRIKVQIQKSRRRGVIGRDQRPGR